MVNEQKLNFEKSTGADTKEFFFLENPDTVDDNNTPTKDFTPCANMTISNNGSTDLKVYKNGASGYDIVPAGTIYTFEASNVQREGLNNLMIHNVDLLLASSYTVVLDSSDTMKSLMYKMSVK